MTVEQLISALQRVADKRALVLFSYDSRVCCPEVTCVDLTSDANEQDQRVFASDFVRGDTASVPAIPAVVLRSEDKDEYNWHRAEDKRYANNTLLFAEWQ